MSRDTRAGKAFVELYVKNSRLIKGLRNAQRRLRNFGTAASLAGRQMMLGGAVMMAPFVIGTRTLVGFSDTMLTVKAVTSATTAEFAKLTDQAKELGRTTSYTAGQVGEGMVSLGRAGFDPGEVREATDDILALARATRTELADAAEIAAAAMNGFNLAADQMERITDVQAYTVNNSAQTLDDYGEGLKMVASIASEAGDDLEDVSTMMAILANNAIKGTMAGTAIARAYKNLAADKTAAAMKRLGVDVADAAGNMRPLAAIVTDIGKATASMGSKDKLAVFETLFGRGSAAALQLARPTADLRDFRAELDNVTGTAKKTAEEMDSGIGGSFRRFMSAIEGSLIAIGKTIEEPLKVASEFATVLAGLFTEIAEAHPKAVAAFAAIAVGVTAAGGALMALGITAMIMAAGLGGLANVITGIAVILGAVISPAGAAVAAVAALGAGLLYLARNTEPVQAVGKAIKGYADGIAGMVSTVVGDATTAWGGIKAAISAGDTEAAMRVVTATLKLLWARAVSFWMEKTEGFRSWWSDVTYGLASLFIDAVAKIKSAWAGTIGFMQKAWDDWKNSSFTEGLADMLAPIFAKIQGVSVEETRKALTEDFQRGRAGSEERKADIDAQTAAAQAEIEADRTGRQDALADMMAESNKARRSSIAAAQKELEDAKKARDEAVAAAGKSKWSAKIVSAPRLAGDEKQRTPELGTPELAGRGIGAARTGVIFSSAAALAMAGGGGGPQERTAKAAEKTVTRLEKLIGVCKEQIDTIKERFSFT